MIRHQRGGFLAFLDRRDAARLIGAPLPVTAGDLRFLVWQPSGDLAYHEALIRFDASEDAYRRWVGEVGLAPYSAGGGGVHLPIDWSPPEGVSAPDWWRPSPQTPPDAAGGWLGLYGSIAAKWEQGCVYLRLVDTGQRTPPQPAR